MQESALTILLVEDHPGDARLFRESLAEEAGDAFRVTWVQDIAEAIEASAQEIPDAVVLDLNLPDSSGFETFVQMREAGADAPILVLTGLEDDKLGLKAIQQGAQDYMSKADLNGSKLARSLRYAIERHRSRTRELGRMMAVSRGKMVAFAGVKGGVGTTTVTLNVAALLARNTQRSVTAAEMRADYGSFSAHLHESPPHTLATLLRFDPATVSDSVLDKCLVRGRFGFEVLFAASNTRECSDCSPDALATLAERLAQRTAYTMLDLPGVVHPITETLLPHCDFLVLVTERDPSSVAAAQMAIRHLSGGRHVPPMGLVLVNRSLMIDGYSPSQLQSATGCELLGVVPPAPEVSVSAQRSGIPLALHRPLSAPATMLTGITEKIARAVSEPAKTRLAPAPQAKLPEEVTVS